jgi:hypothetical protein
MESSRPFQSHYTVVVSKTVPHLTLTHIFNARPGVYRYERRSIFDRQRKVCAAVSPYRATRNDVRSMIGNERFMEVFVDTLLKNASDVTANECISKPGV